MLLLDFLYTKQIELQVNDLVTVLIDACFDTEAKGDAVINFKAVWLDFSTLKSRGRPFYRITASIVGIRPNGNLMLEGRSEMANGAEVWSLSLTGEVPRQSIGPDRTVHSSVIAERLITFRKKSIVSDKMVRPAGTQQEPVSAAPVPASVKVAVLRQKQEELTKLQPEILQLRAETRTQRQILVRVQMLEFSLTKMRKVGFELPGIASGYLNIDDVSHMLSAKKKTCLGPDNLPIAKAGSDDASNATDWLTGNNIGKILAEPTIVVLEGRPSKFHVGGEIPMPVKDNSKVVEYQLFGTEINLSVTSLGDDRLRLELIACVSEVEDGNSVQINGMQSHPLSVREIDTAIESSFGHPTVLTGMIKTRVESVQINSRVREVNNEICLMAVVTPERVDFPSPVSATTIAGRRFVFLSSTKGKATSSTSPFR